MADATWRMQLGVTQLAAFAIITRSVSEVWERASLTLRVTMDRVSDASEDQLRNS